VPFSALRATTPGGDSWRPLLFDPLRSEDGERLRALMARGAIHFVHDTLDTQLRELIGIRHPARAYKEEELASSVADHLRGAPPWAYGIWCWYPWSGRLVHLLPEVEFRELRTSANRNRITTAEQATLQALRIGVVGLSVGHATALTLAQEEIGGEYRLADFDRLDASNLNRVRAGVHELGLPKAHLTARAIYEINPFARIELHEQGVTADNVEAFLTQGGRLDLLYEECDSLDAKILIRERARANRIPVLMETSDRGMLDVERFDREPDRPLLHGLIGDVRASEVQGLTKQEKVPIVLRILGEASISRRLAASLIDVDATLKTWPQLASSVALGGAINADAGRRIALGTFERSGRFYVDLERRICDRTADRTQLEPEPGPAAGAPARHLAPPPLPDAAQCSEEELGRAVVAYASLAPSGGNCQPWRFRLSGGVLRIYYEQSRSGSLLDFDDRGSRLALGAALENALWAARAMGIDPEVQTTPDDRDPDCAARLNLRARSPASAEAIELVRAIGSRVTNRRLGRREPLGPEPLRKLRDLGEAFGVRLDVVDDPRDMAELGDILAEGDRFRFYCERTHREMMSELRWTPQEAERTRDGIDLATLEMSAGELAGLRIVATRPVIEEVVRVGGGQGLGSATRKAIAAASAVGRLTVEGKDAQDFVRGGRAVQRIWVEANRLGIAFQPMTALPYLFARIEHGGGDAFTPTEREWLAHLRERYLALLSLPAGTSELMLFRLAVAGEPRARSLRRPVDDILSIDPATP
jgi:molybdopterin/thiamine biosynthesis adenylyltransferase/nitroreductase